ncbi:F0F1 ATP synthase subunit B, partial [Patescibacteria group bacterium]|nr:F0F1 ATP synthase subunit B [Patescibacteria group bacterium]
DWRMALANLVNFLIIFFVLKKYAFKPIKEKLEEREKKIKTGLEDAEKSATEWRMTQQTREKTLFDARKKANEIVGQANTKAEEIIGQSKKQAEEKTLQIIENSAKELIKQKKQMVADLKTEMADLVIATTEKVLREKVDQEKDKKFIKNFLD